MERLEQSKSLFSYLFVQLVFERVSMLLLGWLTLGFRLYQNEKGILRFVNPAPKPLWYFSANNKLATLYQRALMCNHAHRMQEKKQVDKIIY